MSGARIEVPGGFGRTEQTGLARRHVVATDDLALLDVRAHLTVAARGSAAAVETTISVRLVPVVADLVVIERAVAAERSFWLPLAALVTTVAGTGASVVAFLALFHLGVATHWRGHSACVVTRGRASNLLQLAIRVAAIARRPVAIVATLLGSDDSIAAAPGLKLAPVETCQSRHRKKQRTAKPSSTPRHSANRTEWREARTERVSAGLILGKPAKSDRDSRYDRASGPVPWRKGFSARSFRSRCACSGRS